MFYKIRPLFCLALVSASEALAQGAAPTPATELAAPTFTSSLAENAPVFAIIFLIFYYMVVKPQQTKQRQQEQLVKDLAKGATVLTSSGIIGRVAGIEKDHILLELAANVKVRFQPSSIVKSLDIKAELDSQKVKA